MKKKTSYEKKKLKKQKSESYHLKDFVEKYKDHIQLNIRPTHVHSPNLVDTLTIVHDENSHQNPPLETQPSDNHISVDIPNDILNK